MTVRCHGGLDNIRFVTPRHALRVGPRAALATAGLALGVLAGCATTQVANAPSTSGAATQSTKAATTTTATTVAPTTTRATTTTVKPDPPTTETTSGVTMPSNRVAVGPASAPIGAVGQGSGDATANLQQRLLDLGFWLTGVDGSYGLTTQQAVMAFQKYKGIPASGSVDQATADALTLEPYRAYGVADAGDLVEIDKTRQVLFLVNGGKVTWAFNTSTANGEEYTEPDQNTPGEEISDVAVTPDGMWAFERERPEGWWEGDLGQIYRPKYFVGGVAVHGSNSIPNYPASHGCVRVSVSAMDYIWDSGIMPLRLPVLVHGEWNGNTA
jgi:peptidoglycan hydrolase-like protein with peptidoglycan-binding domain